MESNDNFAKIKRPKQSFIREEIYEEDIRILKHVFTVTICEFGLKTS